VRARALRQGARTQEHAEGCTVGRWGCGRC
jgi:hypothetical protein